MAITSIGKLMILLTICGFWKRDILKIDRVLKRRRIQIGNSPVAFFRKNV